MALLNYITFFKIFTFTNISMFAISSMAQNVSRWKITLDNSIQWHINDSNIPHEDHIEMSGKTMSAVLRYGVNSEGEFVLNKSLVWPLLRTIPNNTHASLMRRYDWNPLDGITVNGRSLQKNEKVEDIILRGKMLVKSKVNQPHNGQWEIIREYLPSTELPALIELYKIVNIGKNKLSIEVPYNGFTAQTDPKKGVEGSYIIEGRLYQNGYFTLQPGDTLCFSASISAYDLNNDLGIINTQKERKKRDSLVNVWMNNLVLETPDSIINNMFAFSKIRACESIYETQGGPMHGPGGESYYAAIWANDQAEYINPYFPYIGYTYGNSSALNAFQHFARFINNEWKPLPSSIIAEGVDVWAGVGDRGDAAMVAYGASRYALSLGNRQIAELLWPLIVWCLDYCNYKLNEEGVVASDTDELENRFESGDANLCTSSLYYDALISASYLAKELMKGSKIVKLYQKRAQNLRKNIDNYFAAKVEGFDTYAYYKGNKILRSWICIPLTVGIDERAKGTIQALFSSRLWTENGLLTEAGGETFWDRSTLYALRGVYIAGETEKATEYLHNYSQSRLLGEHVPYAIEAWPEGEQRHLSAESGLYGRIITEGLFGIRPIGFGSFSLTPRLPQTWDKMALRRIGAFGTSFDLEISRSIITNKLQVKVIDQSKETTYVLEDGDTINVNLR